MCRQKVDTLRMVRCAVRNALESTPYRFVAGLTGCSDSGRVLRLLHEGQVDDVLEAYTGPLLRRSGALAVEALGRLLGRQDARYLSFRASAGG